MESKTSGGVGEVLCFALCPLPLQQLIPVGFMVNFFPDSYQPGKQVTTIENTKVCKLI
jgi:hypothetical protein